MNNFLVYKSSAGSGKTYTLMRVYLEIVLKDPSRFRNILAITFTNKAANEIKQRILSNLRLLSVLDQDHIPQKIGHLVTSLSEATGFDVAALKESAARVLTLILHGYGDFAVSTIDSFMHRIIRSFSFDLKLSMNFEVEMDTAMLQAETVDLLLAGVGNDRHVTDVLVKFVQERAESDENWQIERDLQQFSNNLFREDAVAMLPLLGEFTPERLSLINRKLSQQISTYETNVRKPAIRAFQLIQSQGIDPESFYYSKTGIYSYFRKVSQGDVVVAGEPNSYVRKTIENNEWLSTKGKKSPDASAIISISAELTSCYREIEAIVLAGEGQQIICNNIRSNLYPMAVLGELNLRFQEVKKERNVISIAEFNRIISSIVANEPVPFIYERTGEKFRHYLIDEFQDTSVLQWQNLLPLVENSLSHGGRNMIVGDGKQAIYRFRNGEVDQFVKLPEIDNPSGNELVTQRALALRREFAPFRLDSNFRSKCEVVEFNNSFFRFASGAFLPDFREVYDGLDQKTNPDNKGGLVRIEFYDGDQSGFSDHNCKRVLELVEEITGDGYKPGDITVLCRSNKDSSSVATFLNAHGVQVVSSDSLLLSGSPEVNFLINFLTLISDPENDIARVAAAAYLSAINEGNGTGYHHHFSGAMNLQDFLTMLKQAGYDINTGKLRGLSLYDSCEELIRTFDLHLKSPVYMQFLLDEVLMYASGINTGIGGFIEYWEQNKTKLSVVLPLSPEAVQIMTIHKSKGLEFPVVIYAFADDDVRKLTRKSTWVELNDAELPELPVAMIRIDKSLAKTRLAEIYNTEFSKSKLDLLNMAYVAFTRAAERLYVLAGKQAAPGDEIRSIHTLIREFLMGAGIFSEGKLIYEFGQAVKKQPILKDTVPEKVIEAGFLTSDWRSRLVFAARAPRVWQASGPGESQASGNLLHLALSMIITPDDLETACDKLVLQGFITGNEQADLKKKLNAIINHKDVRPFFSAQGEIAVETEILAPGGKSYRPDRVIFHKTHTDVIDYKTGKPYDSHKNQIRHYAALLSQMGYPDLKAWLIYLEEPVEVIEVK
ncbi:MAG: UvrD/REP helicase [Bacteroidetes bacterium]|nr:MAG: UvrD/REP helicase [Bacteroidota bacterium]